MFFFRTIFLFFLFAISLQANVYHHYFDQSTPLKKWQKKADSSFSTLLVCWNSERPKEGSFDIYVQVETDKGLSPWLLYATWGKDGQMGHSVPYGDNDVRICEDEILVKKGSEGKAFHLRIESKENADVDLIRSVHVYTKEIDNRSFNREISTEKSYFLPVPKISQMALPTKHADRLCSPTSTAAAVQFLSQDSSLEPLEFAKNVWDKSHDIFGNWIFNVAHAASILGSNWNCWVEKLQNFDPILEQLSNDTPVVISIKGPLPGSAEPYASGHLITIIGYDAETKEVICMDPAFPSDEKTYVRYVYDDLMKAWERRGFVAYIFKKTLSLN